MKGFMMIKEINVVALFLLKFMMKYVCQYSIVRR